VFFKATNVEKHRSIQRGKRKDSITEYLKTSISIRTIHQYNKDIHGMRFTKAAFDGINAIAIQALNMSLVIHEHCKMIHLQSEFTQRRNILE